MLKTRYILIYRERESRTDERTSNNKAVFLLSFSKREIFSNLMSEEEKGEEDSREEMYSLWLTPFSDTEYRDAISTYDSIGFRPHVTLSPSFRCERRLASRIAKEISKRLKGFKIELEVQEIDHSSAFFKSIFIRIKSTDSLMRATAIARGEIESTLSSGYPRKDEAFDPHISITYGDRSQEERKRIVVEVLKKYDSLRKHKTFASNLIVVCTSQRKNYNKWEIHDVLPISNHSPSSDRKE